MSHLCMYLCSCKCITYQTRQQLLRSFHHGTTPPPQHIVALQYFVQTRRQGTRLTPLLRRADGIRQHLLHILNRIPELFAHPLHNPARSPRHSRRLRQQTRTHTFRNTVRQGLDGLLVGFGRGCDIHFGASTFGFGLGSQNPLYQQLSFLILVVLAHDSNENNRIDGGSWRA